MTKEEKLELLAALCGYFPYGVKCNINFNQRNGSLTTELLQEVITETITVKPYLRPMSSMTEEEINEIQSMGFAYWETMINNDLRVNGPMSLLDAIITHNKMAKLIGWLNTHHFDYRGLIEKGFALEAPEGMYNNASEQ